MIKKVMTKLHIHVSHKVLHVGAHWTEMTYLILVFVTSHGPYTWAAGTLFVIKVIAVIKHEEV